MGRVERCRAKCVKAARDPSSARRAFCLIILARNATQNMGSFFCGDGCLYGWTQYFWSFVSLLLMTRQESCPFNHEARRSRLLAGARSMAVKRDLVIPRRVK